MRVLIDTNVILDVWLARKPFLADSARTLSAAESGQITGIVCSTTITTLHYLVKKLKGDATARRLLRDLLKICELGAVQRTEIECALASKIKDFEDAVIESVVIETESVIIATRNLSDFKKSRVRAMEPKQIVETYLTKLT